MERTRTIAKPKTITGTREKTRRGGKGDDFDPEIRKLIENEIKMAKQRIAKTQDGVRSARKELKRLSKAYPDSPAVRTAGANVSENVREAETLIEREKTRLEDLKSKHSYGYWKKWIPHPDRTAFRDLGGWSIITIGTFLMWLLGTLGDFSLVTWPLFVWVPALAMCIRSLIRGIKPQAPQLQTQLENDAQALQKNITESVDLLYMAAQRAKEGAKGVVDCIESYEYCKKQYPTFWVACALGYATCVLAQIPSSLIPKIGKD